MKRLICFALCFCFLCGCSMPGERMKEPVVFYYIRDDYQKDMESVIASEIREASGHSGDLAYLLALYSMGPSQENLKAVLPRNTRILSSESTDHGIVVTLSEAAMTLTDSDFTLASACLALTCMEIIDTQHVTIVCNDKSITMQKDALMLHHNLTE